MDRIYFAYTPKNFSVSMYLHTSKTLCLIIFHFPLKYIFIQNVVGFVYKVPTRYTHIWGVNILLLSFKIYYNLKQNASLLYCLAHRKRDKLHSKIKLLNNIIIIRYSLCVLFYFLLKYKRSKLYNNLSLLKLLLTL